MLKGIRSIVPIGRPLQRSVAGNALLLHPRGRRDPAAWRFAACLARDEQHTLVVVDIPDDTVGDAAEAVTHALSDRPGSLRLVLGGGTSQDVRRTGQRIADSRGALVVVPDGELLPTAGGGLSVPGGRGSGWLRMRPGRPPEHDSMHFPKPHWQFSTMDRPWATSPYGVVEPLPCGVWLRGARPDAAAENRRWLFDRLYADPDVMTVVLGCPGGPAVPLADVAGFWATVMPSVRRRTRFVHFGPVALPQEGEALGQQLADLLDAQVAVLAGVPVEARTAPDLPPRTAPRLADGRLGDPAFAAELRYAPRGAATAAPPPVLVGVREPLSGYRPLGTGVYEYTLDAVLEVVQSGLWVRPHQEPADGDDVRRIPPAPGETLVLFDRGAPGMASRMHALAEDIVWRLGADGRTGLVVRPADDPALDTSAWSAEPVAVPDARDAVAAAIPAPARPAGVPPWAAEAAAEAVTEVPAEPAAAGENVRAAGGAVAPVPVPVPEPARTDDALLSATAAADLSEPPVRGLREESAPPAERPSAPQQLTALDSDGMPSPPTAATVMAEAGAAEAGALETPVSGTAVAEPDEPADGVGTAEGATRSGVTVQAATHTAPPESAAPRTPAATAEPGPLPLPGADRPAQPHAAPPATPAPALPIPTSTEPSPTPPTAVPTPAPASPAPNLPTSTAPDTTPPATTPSPVATPAPALPFPTSTDPSATPPTAAASPTAPAPAAAPAAVPPVNGITRAAPGGPAGAPAAPRPVGLRLESSEPVPSAGADRTLPEAVPDAPSATAPTVAAGARVLVQPVPKGAACAVPPERGIEREREWVRKTFRAQYDALAGTVARVMSQVPGLRDVTGGGAVDAETDLVALRLYLSGNHAEVDAAVRSARTGPHVPLARCVASGLRRLPSHRGPTLFDAELSAAQRAWYTEGRLVTEWAFCAASLLPAGSAPAVAAPSFLMWSMTARRTGPLDSGAPDRVIFLPGTAFKVLRPAEGPESPVLLRELTPQEVGPDGRVAPGRIPLDDLALESLTRAADSLSAKPAPVAPGPRSGPAAVPPGLLSANGRPRTGVRPPAPAESTPHKGATL
ncbi:hypothetical protein SAMN05216251_10678 [Actinacidiphila alni]|uniref:Basic proline-rich protein n=1 Tax=Actinacidiphila alni TaxID=380248 RepID=A0A1I2E8S0_9ACTN|nr:hypothetical protein [Actinacidiphila alni]SFE89087.1 hypothetical protein SAMN05216251_10678 [Actinacidiphila alni]